MKTIQELNQIICDAMGVSIEKYETMNILDQNKLRQAYMKKVHGLNTRKSK